MIKNFKMPDLGGNMPKEASGEYAFIEIFNNKPIYKNSNGYTIQYFTNGTGYWYCTKIGVPPIHSVARTQVPSSMFTGLWSDYQNGKTGNSKGFLKEV